jgi:hypothetical protein
VEPVLQCFKFEVRFEALGDQFQAAASKWEEHVKKVVLEREEVIKRT